MIPATDLFTCVTKLISDLGLVIHDAHILICCQVQTNLSAQLVKCPLTVKHILVQCTDFKDSWTKYFVTSSLEELFRTVDVRNVLDFIKETHFYSKL